MPHQSDIGAIGQKSRGNYALLDWAPNEHSDFWRPNQDQDGCLFNCNCLNTVLKKNSDDCTIKYLIENINTDTLTKSKFTRVSDIKRLVNIAIHCDRKKLDAIIKSIYFLREKIENAQFSDNNKL